MPLINLEGKNISFECNELINELKSDISEFGGQKEIFVWCKDVEGVTIFANYDFINEDDLIDESELKDGEYFKKMAMADLLELLEKQNSIF